MEKTAQRRGILNRLNEMTNVSGIAAEKFFNPQFKKVMESLREKDDQIRSLIAGEVIGKGDPGSDPVSLKNIIKAAKSNLNRREYMVVVADLGRFHKRLSEIARLIDALDNNVDEVHHQFLFGTEENPILKPEHRQHLDYLKKNFASQKNELTKQAGMMDIMDFFYNIGNKRGRALAAWEKRYPEVAKRLSQETTVMLTKSEAVLDKLLSSMKEMGSFRADRNVDLYMKSAKNIRKIYDKYHQEFSSYYKQFVLPRIEKMDFSEPVAETKTKTTEKIPETINDPKLDQSPLTLPNIPSLISPTNTNPLGPIPEAVAPKISPSSLKPVVQEEEEEDRPTLPAATLPATTIPTAPPPMSLGPMGMSQTQRSLSTPFTPSKAPDIQVKTHKKFMESLESMAGENPAVLSLYIAKYAKAIQNSSPDTAVSLFKIAKSIKE